MIRIDRVYSRGTFLKVLALSHPLCLCSRNLLVKTNDQVKQGAGESAAPASATSIHTIKPGTQWKSSPGSARRRSDYYTLMMARTHTSRLTS